MEGHDYGYLGGVGTCLTVSTLGLRAEGLRLRLWVKVPGVAGFMVLAVAV